jgi:MAK-like kinase
VDIFALAAIIIELYTMTPLFPGSNEVETLNKVVELLGTPKKE